MGKFELTDYDVRMISIAINAVRRLLQNPQITSQDIIGLGNALYALERLPLVTPGAFSGFRIISCNVNEESSVMRYVSFLISDSAFTVFQEVREFYDEVCDYRFSGPRWEVKLDGHRRAELSMVFSLVDDINEYLEFGAEIIVNDDSQIRYEWNKYQPLKRRSVKPLRMAVSRHAERYQSNELIMNIFPD